MLQATATASAAQRREVDEHNREFVDYIPGPEATHCGGHCRQKLVKLRCFCYVNVTQCISKPVC